MSEMITVKTSNIPGELAVAKSYLEDQNVYCFLKDELINQVQPFAVGGIKLQVREEDAEQAINLLLEGGFTRKEDYEIPESTLFLVKWYEKIASWFGNK